MSVFVIVIVVACVVELSGYLSGRKYPEMRKKLNKIYLGILCVLILLCIMVGALIVIPLVV